LPSQTLLKAESFNRDWASDKEKRLAKIQEAMAALEADKLAALCHISNRSRDPDRRFPDKYNLST
jgi:hypothetical protein